MKNESEFLPVSPFWRKQKPVRWTGSAFVWGMVAGATLSLLVNLVTWFIVHRIL